MPLLANFLLHCRVALLTFAFVGRHNTLAAEKKKKKPSLEGASAVPMRLGRLSRPSGGEIVFIGLVHVRVHNSPTMTLVQDRASCYCQGLSWDAAIRKKLTQAQQVAWRRTRGIKQVGWEVHFFDRKDKTLDCLGRSPWRPTIRARLECFILQRQHRDSQSESEQSG